MSQSQAPTTTYAIQVTGIIQAAHEAYLEEDYSRSALLALGALRTNPRNAIHRFLLAMLFTYSRNRQAICALPLARKALERLEQQVVNTDMYGIWQLHEWERQMVADFRDDYDAANRKLVKEQIKSKVWLSYAPRKKWCEVISQIRDCALRGQWYMLEQPETEPIAIWEEGVDELLSPEVEGGNWFLEILNEGDRNLSFTGAGIVM